MGEFEGTNFTIIDPADKKTLAFAIEKSEGDEVFSLQKLDCSVENEGGKYRKTFFYEYFFSCRMNIISRRNTNILNMTVLVSIL